MYIELIICNRNDKEATLIKNYIFDYYRDKNITLYIQSCNDWQELMTLVKTAQPDVIIIALDGVEGLDIITEMRISSGKIIWFSNLDFGLQAYRQCVSYFSMKPISYEKIASALDHVN